MDSRSSRKSWTEWERTAQFYQAVEEEATPELTKIYNEQAVWDYLSKPIPGYLKAVKKLAKPLSKSLVKGFILEHGKSG